MSRPADLAPEAHNAEQDDAPAQAQTLADEARGRASNLGGSDTERAPAGAFDLSEDGGGTPDLIDKMEQMVADGRIDLGAFRGERNDDDEDYALGEQGIEDDFPRGAE